MCSARQSLAQTSRVTVSSPVSKCRGWLHQRAAVEPSLLMLKSACSGKLAIASLARASPWSATLGLTWKTCVLPGLEAVAVTVPAQLLHVCDAAQRVSHPYVDVVRSHPAVRSAPFLAANSGVAPRVIRHCSAILRAGGLHLTVLPSRATDNRGYDLLLHATTLATPDHILHLRILGQLRRDGREPHSLVRRCLLLGLQCSRNGCAKGQVGSRTSGRQAARLMMTHPGRGKQCSRWPSRERCGAKRGFRKSDVRHFTHTKPAAAGLVGGAAQPALERIVA